MKIKILLNETKYPLLLALLISASACFCLNIFLYPPDTAAYYSVARSFIFDFDQNFTNEYENFNFLNTMFWITSQGYLSNDWPIGTGLLSAPFLILGHLFGLIVKVFAPSIRLDGYSPIYQLFSSFGMIFIALAGLWASFAAAAKFSGQKNAFISCVLIFFGSPLFFYMNYANLMSHVPGFGFVSLFIYCWSLTIDKRERHDWVLLGLLLGISALIRPQNVIVASIFVPEFFNAVRLKLRGQKNTDVNLRIGILLFFLMFLLGFLPQFLFWGKIYGRTLQFPKLEEMDWLKPHLFSMIFSDYHGILLWTPLVILSLPGIFYLFKNNKILSTGLLIFIILEFYVNACNRIWWASGSLGNRRLVDAGAVFIIFLAMLLSQKKIRFLLPLFIIAAFWTLILIASERRQIITLEHYEIWDMDYIKRVLSNLKNPFDFFASFKGDFAGKGIIVRIILSSALMMFSVIAVFFYKFYREDKKFLTTKSIVKFIIMIWVVLAALYSLALFTTKKPDLSKTLTELNYECVSLWHNYYEMGFYYLSKRDYEQAEEVFKKAIEIYPKQPMPYRYLASIYRINGELLPAMQYGEKAIEIHPDYDMAKIELIQIYKTILSFYPDDVTIKNKLGKLEKEMSQKSMVK